MIILDITNIPNQRFSFSVENDFYDVSLKACGMTMACDISVNNILIASGIRCVSGAPILGYRHLEFDGDFLFLTDNDDYPYYTEFGITQFLCFYPALELFEIAGIPT